MMKLAALVAAMVAVAEGACPNACSGHGQCGQYDSCSCHVDWMGGMTVMALADQHPELFGGAGDGAATSEAPRSKVIGAVLISTAASTVDPATWLPKPLRPAVRIAMPSMMTGASRGRMAEMVERSRQSASDIAFLGTRHIGFGDPRVSPTVVDFLERSPAAAANHRRAIAAH